MKIIIIFPDGAGGGTKKPNYNPAGHSEGCQQRHAAAEAWATLWPNHCAKCRGAGMLEYSDDPSPAGVCLSAGSIDYAEPCSCVCDERCPRCGESLLGCWWQHPRRHLAAAIRAGEDRAVWAFRRAGAAVVTGALTLGRVPEAAKARAGRRIAAWLQQHTATSDAISVFAEWVAPVDFESPCGFCGWTGELDSDAMPPAECLCWEEHEAEVQAAAAAGSICWRCERAFDGEKPGVQATIPVFGVRWLHTGCMFDGDRLVGPTN